MSTPTTLYRLFDQAGQVLYIGIATHPGKRFDQHATTKSWWPEVASMSIERYPTRPAAHRAEVLAIGAERPRHNQHHTGNAGLPQQPERSTPLQRYLDLVVTEKAGKSLADFVLELRKADTSWRRISFAIYKLTQEDVTSVTLMSWYPEADAA